MPKHSFHAYITKIVIDRMLAGDIVWDTGLKSFGARCQASSVSYILKTRVNGRQKWITIGKHGQPWTPQTARKKALELKINPHIDAISKPKNSEIQTLSQLIDRYKKNHYPKISPRTRKDYDDVFRLYILPALGEKQITSLDYSDITEFHASLNHIPRRANLSLATLSALMNWAEQLSHRPRNSNPCTGIKKYPENKRERFLSIEEIIALGTALNDAEQNGEISIYAAAAIRLLIFTGARLSEILTLEWSFVKLDARKLYLPKSKTGKKTISLSLEACAILEAIPRLANNPHVIVGQIEGAHLVNIAKPWNLIRTAAKLDDVRIHDLRHSFASFAAEKGASLVMIGKLLGHTQSQTTARYTHLTDASMTDLNDQIGDSLGKAMAPKKASHE